MKFKITYTPKHFSMEPLMFIEYADDIEDAREKADAKFFMNHKIWDYRQAAKVEKVND